MKTRNLLGLGVMSMVSFFLLASCQQEDSNPTDQLNETEETAQEVDLNASLDDIDEVTLSGFQRNGYSDRTLVTLEEDLCGKAKIEWLPNLKKMVIDFGDGCTSPKGVERKGKIIVTYTGKYWAPNTKVTTTFDNFYVDSRKIEGIRVVTNLGFNENDKFFSFKTVVEGGKITWPDGTFRTFEARHTKKIFLPIGDKGIVYALSGGNKGINRDGKEYVVEITKPLITTEKCIRSGIRIPISGTKTIKVAGKEKMTIDFGSDVCDREVTITVGDKSKTTTLPRS